MLTGLAILERELGLVEYARWELQRRLGTRNAGPEAALLQKEYAALEDRKRRTLRLLAEKYDAYEARHDAS